jgi:RNA polymerase sigma-70 factor (ECF subfamily)
MFPETEWALFSGLQHADTRARSISLDTLIRRYWRPIYLFIRQHGFGKAEAEAEDLTQDFFALWLAKDNFAKADSAKGRFRDLLQASLRRFLANAARAKHAQKRMPPRGLVSIQEMEESDGRLISISMQRSGPRARSAPICTEWVRRSPAC